MRKVAIYLLIIWACVSWTWGEEISSLSQVFLLGKGIQDLDGDDLAEKVNLQIIIPNSPNAYELAVAGDICARANLESLVVDFLLVSKPAEMTRQTQSAIPIFIGSSPNAVREENISEHQGLVKIVSQNGRSGLMLLAGSDEALLKTGRAFFLRWPYFWDIWGREQGHTYFSLEKDLQDLLAQDDVNLEQLVIHSALYEFPPLKSSHDAIKRLNFNSGEIKALTVHLHFSDENQKTKAYQSLEALAQQHRQGKNSETLSYPGCAQVVFELFSPDSQAQVAIRRMGYTKRFLTPGYKSINIPRIPARNFDLLNFFTINAAYQDTNRDKMADKINTAIVIAPDLTTPEISRLSTRLVMPTAGASFPLLYIDSEIEDPKALDSVILIGQNNSLIKELIKNAKLKTPFLQSGQGIVQVVSEAFNKSNAIAILGGDKQGLAGTIDYFSRIFPRFTQYREGIPSFSDIPIAVEEFLSGERGSAEAYFYTQLNKILDDIKDKDLESFTVKFALPQENQTFHTFIENQLKETITAEELQVQSHSLDKSKMIFDKTKKINWEGKEALTSLEKALPDLNVSDQLLYISLGVSESPPVRQALNQQICQMLEKHGHRHYLVEVFSSYKQGYFWLTEKILPQLQNPDIKRLTIRFAEEKEDFSQPKRFYSEPFRWLQELYPVDDIIAQKSHIPLDQITFEMMDKGKATYEVYAFNSEGQQVLAEYFSPHKKNAIYLAPLPEWGEVTLTTGWLKIQQENTTILEQEITSDMEKFWKWYQQEILPEVYAHILKKTGNEPTFRKQPYFKRLLIEMWLSEPDYKIGLDEEIISSLESIHDEIYFDTLDFLRGITEIKTDEQDLPEDSSRYSAPGNILPKIHPSLEGESGKITVQFEDWISRTPQMELSWKVAGKTAKQKKISFPKIKPKSVRIPAFIYDSKQKKLVKLLSELEIEKEKDYLALINIADTLKVLQNKNILKATFQFPDVKQLVMNIKHKDLTKEVLYSIPQAVAPQSKFLPIPPKTEIIVPVNQIISPQMCLDIVQQLSSFDSIQSYIAGASYEKREVPVLEIFTPLHNYVSIARLVTAKPTLYLSGRQHANEVSATNYILKFAELLAKDPKYQEYLKKINFVLHPLENPDGAELAYQLQKLTPFHSLHAGRYSALGIDVGYQVGSSQPLLPEAKVRRYMNEKWLPDIYLNLHGYPSHEWVQQFSNYSPYQFRDYWIPRGWFAYFRALTLPLYKDWVEASQSVKNFIVQGMQNNSKVHASNQQFYDRYYRWATRWQPHMNYLERYQGVNLYAKRRSSRESRLSDRQRITYLQETPELMDETAQGDWLEFLCQQGLTYLRAHSDYLFQAEHEIERIEEEGRYRIHIQFIRKRPPNRIDH